MKIYVYVYGLNIDLLKIERSLGPSINKNITTPKIKSASIILKNFDFSIYIDADEEIIQDWYVSRFMRLRETAFQKPESFFHRYSQVSDSAALAIAMDLWTRINLVNLHENILPTRQRADLVLHKGSDHAVDRVALRRL